MIFINHTAEKRSTTWVPADNTTVLIDQEDSKVDQLVDEYFAQLRIIGLSRIMAAKRLRHSGFFTWNSFIFGFGLTPRTSKCGNGY